MLIQLVEQSLLMSSIAMSYKEEMIINIHSTLLMLVLML